MSAAERRPAPAAPGAPPAGDEGAAAATERIGERLASLRAQRRMRISDLARRVQVSPSLISQIERGQSRPSVTTLFALAQQLDVPVDAFFEEHASAASAASAATRLWRGRNGSSDGERYLVKRHERSTLDILGGVRWERLTRTALSPLEFMELVYEPGAESAPQLYRHPGLECVLVTENRLHIAIGDELNRLEEGDSVAFPSTLRHRYLNPTDRVSRAITVILRD